MTLHLFDPAEPGPTLSELLEGFWDGKPREPLIRPVPVEVWLLTSIDCSERGPDSFMGTSVYRTKEEALWSVWFDDLDTAMEPGYFDGDFITPAQWFAETLKGIQNLRDDGDHFDDGILVSLSCQEMG